MAKRGRKPKGEFEGKLANFSTRIQPETRKALEAEAKATGLSISQLAEKLLINGLKERRATEKDPAMRALCFLIAQLARHVVGPTEADWRSHPFFYEAFKFAVVQLLDALDPPGTYGEQQMTVAEPPSAALNPSLQRYLASFQNPQARAEYSADLVLSLLREIPFWNEAHRDEANKIVSTVSSSSVGELYGMSDAAEDLAVRPTSEGKKNQSFNMKTVYWGDFVSHVKRRADVREEAKS
jgi:hypothetical protein